ncbi:breast cancer type 2 susceptibility protein-like [Papilio machaon]|uniref:breast cancer type 2 susceptibility protein-like n=1 Tax=Papilio machaon TaxID=76193 RepID=UPI001E6637E2|nr:breast cancer type 2 susceptibility protein-like [Papilio machaon]
MDEDSDNTINFESILKNSNLKKQQTIYSEDVSCRLFSKEKYTPKDVLSNVSKQVNELQRADSKKSDKNRLRLMNVVKPALEPLNLVYNRPPQSYHKFETQGVSDTQLINIVVNAEMSAAPKGATQEFENSFCEHHFDEKKHSPNVLPVIATRKESNLVVNKAPDSINSKLEDVPSTSKIYNDKEKQNAHTFGKNLEKSEDHNSESIMTLSPIIGRNEPLQLPETSQSLIYTLDAFENFETLAFPVIEQNPDIDLAKAIINSQIIDKELCIPCANPIISKETSISPILTNRISGITRNNKIDVNRIDKEPFKEPDKATNNIIETKLKKSFEEDIFCSDEENNGDIQLLPETCALENSLGNARDILEKTMYVGFQTASNKSIQIQTDSFCKAQNILDDLDDHNCNQTIMELVEMCDNTSKNHSNDVYHSIDVDKPASNREAEQLFAKDVCATNLFKTNANTICAAKELNIAIELMNLPETRAYDEELEQVIKKPKNTKDNSLIGFKTASSKKINLSDKALARCRQVFQDINIDEIFDSNEPSNNLSSTMHSAVEQNIDGDSKIKTQCNCDKDQNVLIEVSEQIALNDQTILQEFENDLIAPPITDLKKKQPVDKSENLIENQRDEKGFNKNMMGDHFKKHSGSNSDELHIQHKTLDVNKEIFIGFKTANNKKIKISEHALAKTKNVFEDINLSNDEVGNDMKKVENMKREIHRHQHIGANKLLNKNMHVKTSSPEISLKNCINTEPNTACGFVTAGKKPIVISSEAIVKSKKIFEDIDSYVKGKIEMSEKIDKNLNKYVKNGNNSHVEVTPQIKNPTNENNKLLNNNKDNYMSHQFKIPSKNQTKISDNVHTKCKLLRDLQDEFPGRCEVKANYALENNNQSKELNNSNQCFKGFQTASNKQVKVSEKSLAASRKLFEYLQINENEHFNVDTKVFDEKHRKIINKDIHDSSPQAKLDNAQTESEKCSFNGFRSASNKIIKISEQAIARSKNLFLDLDINNVIDEQNNNNRESTDKDLVNIEFHENNQPDKKIYDCNTNNSKNRQYTSNEGYRDIVPNSKRIKVLNKDKIDKLSQDSNEENKQIPFSSIENFTSTFGNKGIIKKNFESLFKTANNNDIKISEEALYKSKRVLMDLNENDQVIETKFSQSTHRKNEGNIENMINTQLLNNFEDTLYTEDFCKDIPNKKRCGSPILSCPRAKKPKKFEVPYNKWEIPKTKPKEKDTYEANSSNMFAFDKNYKKNNKLSMKSLRDIEFNNSVVEIDPYIFTFNFDNILNFEFSSKRNEISDNTWSTDDLKKCFLSLVNRKIIPDGWLDNHLKLIIFKLISYEMEYKCSMQGICSVKNVLEQLKYRYDKELYSVERPVLRKLLEKDDVSTKTMVLRVLAIYVDGAIAESIPDTSNVELLLTDGWYCIKASLDQMLIRLVKDQKIRVGTKLVTNGAELLNCEQGIAPWEDTSSVRLKIFGNSTRRARWDAKLGYHSGAAILSRLSCVQLEGGKVSKLRALVTRVYPTLYVEKFDNGSTVTRSERLEHLYQMKFESERQMLLEKIYEEVQKEFVDEESQDSESDVDLRNMETGSQIHRLMKRSRDSEEFLANLTSTQCSTLRRYTDRRRERVLQALQDRVNDRVKEQGLQVGRNVVPVMKIRVADVGDDGEVSKAMMSIWRPNEAVMEIIKEGTWIDAFNIMPTARRYSEIQLSAGRQTVFSRSNYKVNDKVQQIVASLKRTCYSIESLVKMPTLVTSYNEVDVVGLVFLIEPSIAQFEAIKGQHFQNVYLTDTDKNIICVNFWGGLKKFGYENILDIGLVVACMNLQKRTGNSRKGIPQYRATEYSYFTKMSKHSNVRIIMDDLNKTLSTINIKQLCESCVAIKNNSIVKNVENISPYRINYSDYNISKHRAFIDSPLTRKPDHVDDILNLSGLDFESTFKQIDTQDMPANLLLRKKKVNYKIAKLKMYGEPPPLKAIHIINKSINATKEFKSPLASKNDSLNSVTSVKLHEKSNSAISCTESTPEIFNKYTKRIIGNPVKLNFSTNPFMIDGGEKIDPFAEEFDVSPPFSWD